MSTSTDHVNAEQKSQSALVVGLLFAGLIIVTNMLFTESARTYITQSLRSPNGMIVRDALVFFTAFRDVGRNAYMDSDSFVRLSLLANFTLLSMFFFYLGFIKPLTASAVRLSFRLLTFMGVVYIGVLLFDPAPLGQSGSAIQWFQSAGFVACATAAILNFVMVRRLAQQRTPRGVLCAFWFLAAVACFYGALNTRFDITTTLSATLQANLSRFGVVNFQSSFGMPLHLVTPLALAGFTCLIASVFISTLRRYYAEAEFDWHKPFLFALFFLLGASATTMVPANEALTPWLTQLHGILLSGAFVLTLASFSTTAISAGEKYLASLLPEEASAQTSHHPQTASQGETRRNGPPIRTTVEEDVDATVGS